MTININTLSEAIECCKCPIQWIWYIHSCISVYLNTIKFFVPVCWSAWLCGSNTIVKYSWRSWRHLGATGNVATRNGWMGFSVLVAVKDTHHSKRVRLCMIIDTAKPGTDMSTPFCITGLCYIGFSQLVYVCLSDVPSCPCKWNKTLWCAHSNCGPWTKLCGTSFTNMY